MVEPTIEEIKTMLILEFGVEISLKHIWDYVIKNQFLGHVHRLLEDPNLYKSSGDHVYHIVKDPNLYKSRGTSLGFNLVFNDLLDLDLPVHERLPLAEKILKMDSSFGLSSNNIDNFIKALYNPDHRNRARPRGRRSDLLFIMKRFVKIFNLSEWDLKEPYHRWDGSNVITEEEYRPYLPPFVDLIEGKVVGLQDPDPI